MTSVTNVLIRLVNEMHHARHANDQSIVFHERYIEVLGASMLSRANCTCSKSALNGFCTCAKRFAIFFFISYVLAMCVAQCATCKPVQAVPNLFLMFPPFLFLLSLLWEGEVKYAFCRISQMPTMPVCYQTNWQTAHQGRN